MSTSCPYSMESGASMNLLICDHHVVFAESLAHLLTARGYDVAGTTHRFDDLVEVLRRVRVDVCLLDVIFGPDSVVDRLPALRAGSPDTRLMLLTASVDAGLLNAARAAGIRGVADKRHPVAEMLQVLDRVIVGESAIAAETAQPQPAAPAPRHVNDSQRLARFLTAREREVLCGLVRGDDTTKLARSMGIASATARCHIQNVLTKLGTHSRLEAATSAVRDGLVSPETGNWLSTDRNDPRRVG
jgi:two-component system nitrate/nitrite response regulator NarL